MAFKARSIALGTSDTTIYECPASLEAAGKIYVSNVSGSSATLTAKFYDASQDETITIIHGFAIDANKMVPLAGPPSWEQGDILLMSASTEDSLVAVATITSSELSPSAVGFIPEGEWDELTTYGLGALVSDGNGSYVSRSGGNVGNIPASSPAEWQVIAARGLPGVDGETFVWLGEYSDEATYSEQEIVRSGAAVWIALQATTGNEPPVLPDTENAYWELVVKDGDLTAEQVFDTPNEWTAPQRSSVTALTVSSNAIDWTLASSNDFSVTLTANATLNLPSDIASYVGQKGRILITQDGTGDRTFAVDEDIVPLGSEDVPEIPTAPGAMAYFAYDVISATQIAFTLIGVGE